MGKRHRGRVAAGSLLRSIPDSVRSELGLGTRVNGNGASQSPSAHAAGGSGSGSSSVPQKRDRSDDFLSTQPEDQSSEMDEDQQQEISGESDEIEQTLITPDPVEFMARRIDEFVTSKTLPEPTVPEVSALPSPAPSEESIPRRKKRKLDDEGGDDTYDGLLPKKYRRWDASSLVPHFTRKEDMPPSLQKWFPRRHQLFSLYSHGCLLDETGWWSVTPEQIADQIAERCRCDVVLDAFCGVGGNAIAFARTCERVIAIDNSPVRLALARHNAVIYGVAERIEFILGDYPSFARSYAQLSTGGSSQKRKIDVVFLSPPWGGPTYSAPQEGEEAAGERAAYSLESVTPLPGKQLWELTRGITKNVAFYLPRHVDLEEVGGLLHGSGMEAEMVEVEEEWMGKRLTAVTCYFGGLVEGQEEMFDQDAA